MATHKGPVCGMQVDEGNAAGKSEHEGHTYYFRSAGCKARFDQSPGRYAGREGQAPGNGEAR